MSANLRVILSEPRAFACERTTRVEGSLLPFHAQINKVLNPRPGKNALRKFPSILEQAGIFRLHMGFRKRTPMFRSR